MLSKSAHAKINSNKNQNFFDPGSPKIDLRFLGLKYDRNELVEIFLQRDPEKRLAFFRERKTEAE